jgi:hypothetical protein
MAACEVLWMVTLYLGANAAAAAGVRARVVLLSRLIKPAWPACHASR